MAMVAIVIFIAILGIVVAIKIKIKTSCTNKQNSWAPDIDNQSQNSITTNFMQELEQREDVINHQYAIDTTNEPDALSYSYPIMEITDNSYPQEEVTTVSNDAYGLAIADIDEHESHEGNPRPGLSLDFTATSGTNSLPDSASEAVEVATEYVLMNPVQLSIFNTTTQDNEENFNTNTAAMYTMDAEGSDSELPHNSPQSAAEKTQ